MSLPETVRHRTKLTISIISINEQEKQTLLYVEKYPEILCARRKPQKAYSIDI